MLKLSQVWPGSSFNLVYVLFLLLNMTFLKSISRFTEKLRKKFRDFPHTPCPTHAQCPPLSTSLPRSTWLSMSFWHVSIILWAHPCFWYINVCQTHLILFQPWIWDQAFFQDALVLFSREWYLETEIFVLGILLMNPYTYIYFNI